MNRYYNNYLMHYGVKGMKWGVRHDKDRVNLIYSAARTAYLADKSDKLGNTKKSRSEFQDSLVKLSRQEKQYRERYKSEPQIDIYLNSGKTYVNVALKNSKGETVNTLINGQLYKKGKAYIRKNTTSFK